MSAPRRLSLDTLRIFAISKLDWIRRQQRKLREQARETPREYLDRESHFVWGQRYLLTVLEHDAAPRIEREHSRIVLSLRPGTRPLHPASAGSGLLTFLSGPEGGLSTGEEELALAHGFAPVTLGTRVLRAETAPLAALAALTLE